MFLVLFTDWNIQNLTSLVQLETFLILYSKTKFDHPVYCLLQNCLRQGVSLLLVFYESLIIKWVQGNGLNLVQELLT